MKTYPTGIVGESNYQDAITRCVEGELVQICHEPDNPYDKLALRVEDARGETIGYIARVSWVRDCVHEDHRGCFATIKTIGLGEEGLLGVVLNVAPLSCEIPMRHYGIAAQSRQTARKRSEPGSFIAGFLRRIFA